VELDLGAQRLPSAEKLGVALDFGWRSDLSLR